MTPEQIELLFQQLTQINATGLLLSIFGALSFGGVVSLALMIATH